MNQNNYKRRYERNNICVLYTFSIIPSYFKTKTYWIQEKKLLTLIKPI